MIISEWEKEQVDIPSFGELVFVVYPKFHVLSVYQYRGVSHNIVLCKKARLYVSCHTAFDWLPDCFYNIYNM